MRRKLSLVVALVGVLGLIGLAPVAQASHDGGYKNDGPHEGPPTPPVPGDPDGVCVVQGDVFIGDSAGTGGVETDSHNHNHYRFNDTFIDCTAVSAAGLRYDGQYRVDAAGGTDGPWEDPVYHTGAHGENSLLGWSHSSCYQDAGVHAKAPLGCAPPAIYPEDKAKSPPEGLDDLYDGTNENPPGSLQCTNCGEITVRSIDGEVEPGRAADKISDPTHPDGSPASTDNWVKFLREGVNVTAWGALTNFTGVVKAPKPTGEVLCFLAELEFIPNFDGKVIGEDKVNAAELVGTAVVWIVNDKNACAGPTKDTTEKKD